MKLFKLSVMVAVLLSSTFTLAGEKTTAKQFGLPALSRLDFNRLAADMNIPIFWEADKNNSGTVEPNELVPVGSGTMVDFKQTYLALVEAKRKDAVLAELNYGKPTIIASNFKKSSEADRKLVAHIVKAAKIIDELYMEQLGGLKYYKQIPETDKPSLALFHRNHGPWCNAPKTENDPFCNALGFFPPKLSDAYPEGMAQDANLCKKLKDSPQGKELLDPFKVVRKENGKLAAIPITKVYGEKMKAVANELKAAAFDLGTNEPKLKTYLLAAAKGFETNDWLDADEAWVAMNSRNSKWYLRIAPDETYFDPCQEKAGFHTAFATIDLKSLAWQDKLNKVRNEMETELAKLIGEPYKARDVKFNFPDFIEIILNSGDSRHSLGAVIGQSLPNWGKVANEGRSRTLVMSNIYTDPDSVKAYKARAATLLDASTMKYYSETRDTNLLATILHEAIHNFGPYSDYKIDGKNPSAVFGGRLASVLEELKAQTGALWYIDMIKKKGLISDELAKQTYTGNIAWCFGHISQGMFTATGNPKAYSQLAAVQIGMLSQEGAIEWVDGYFHINFDKMPAAVEKLMQKVGKIKATGDVAGANALLNEYFTGAGAKLVHAQEIQDRLLKFPKETFDYSVVY